MNKVDLGQKEYVIVVECYLVAQRCSGYHCEKAFCERTGGFADYPRDKPYRTLYLTCGGCCGQALQRKLLHAAGQLKKTEGITKKQIVVQLASCVSKDNFHGPPCPHLDYLKTLIERTGLDYRLDTHISQGSQARREAGTYDPGDDR